MRFDFYHDPASVGECLEMLVHYGFEGLVFARGTDLVPGLKSRSSKCLSMTSLSALLNH